MEKHTLVKVDGEKGDQTPRSDKSEAEPVVTSSTKWKDVNEIFKHNPIWTNTEDLDRLLAFEEFIRNLEKKDYVNEKR